MIRVKVTVEHVEITTSAIDRPKLTIEFAIDEIGNDESHDFYALLGLQVDLNLPRRIQKCSSKR